MLLVSIPFALPLTFFLSGFLNFSLGFLLTSLLLLAAPGLAAWFAISSFKMTSKKLCVAMVVGMYGIFIASVFVFPPGAVTQATGLAESFLLTKNPKDIQTWATAIIDRYEANEAISKETNPYWSVGHAKISKSEIPPGVQNLWRWNQPAIGIATFSEGGSLDCYTENPKPAPGSTHCVAFSWYPMGILVGRPNFVALWQPWYIREIMPGIYVYAQMK